MDNQQPRKINLKVMIFKVQRLLVAPSGKALGLVSPFKAKRGVSYNI